MAIKQWRSLLPIFLTKMIPMFCYGMLAVILFVNLYYKGFTPSQSSLIQAGIVIGEIIFSLVLRRQAAKFGRIRVLMFGCLLKLFAGLWYIWIENMFLLTLSGIIGVISAVGGEHSPFAQIEESILTDIVEDSNKNTNSQDDIIQVLTYYTMSGYVFQGLGAAFAGYYIDLRTGNLGYAYDQVIKQVIRISLGVQVLAFFCYFFITEKVEKDSKQKEVASLPVKKENVTKVIIVILLFFVNAFGGAFVTQSFLSYFYEAKFGLQFFQIGVVLLFCNISDALSGLYSFQLFKGYGAISNLIYSQIPAHTCMVLIAFTTNSTLSLSFLFFSFCCSQMNLSQRQVLDCILSKEEQESIKGTVFVVQSLGLALGLGFNGYFMNQIIDSSQFSRPFLIAGALKLIYDVSMAIILKSSNYKIKVFKRRQEINQNMSLDQVEQQRFQ